MNRIIKILLLASIFLNFAGGLFTPFYAFFIEKIGGGFLEAGAAYSGFGVAASILMIVLAKIEDKTKYPELFLSIGFFLSFLGYLALIGVKNTLHMFIVEIIWGLGTAITDPIYDSIYSKNLDKGESAFEWGLWEASTNLVLAISSLIGGLIVSVFGFKVLFFIMLLFSFAGFLLSLFLYKNKKLKRINMLG